MSNEYPGFIFKDHAGIMAELDEIADNARVCLPEVLDTIEAVKALYGTADEWHARQAKFDAVIEANKIFRDARQ